MSAKVTVEFDVNFTRGRRGRKRATAGRNETNQKAPAGRIPRVTKLLALAHRIEHLVRDGEIKDYAEAARLGQVTRARMSQVLNLLNLSPAIQQEILDIPRVDTGRDPISERDLRPIMAVADWKKQRRMWDDLSVSAGRE